MRMLSPVLLPGDPAAALAASTKQYIDAGLALKLDATATPSLPPPGPSPASILGIGVKLGQSHFSLQSARLGDSTFFVKTTTDIAGGYEESPLYYGADALKLWVACRVQVGAPTTSGSSYSRTEHREQGENNLDYGFDATDANTHYIQGRFRIVHAPANTPDIVCVQLHNGTTDRLTIRTQLVSGTWRLRIRFNGSTVTLDAGGTDVLTGIANIQGADIDFKMQIVNGLPTVWLGLASDPNTLAVAKYTGATAFTSTGSASWYWKFGCYLQTTTASDTSTDYGEVWHYGPRLQHWHTGWTTPAPFYAVAKHAGSHAPGAYDDLSPNYLNLGGAQTVVGQKTFNPGPLVPAAAAAGSAIPRSDLDDRAGAWRASRWGISAYTVHPMSGLTSGSYGPNSISLVRAFVPAGVSIANLAAALATAATVTSGSVASGGFLNGLAIYEISGTTATLAASYTGTFSMWTTAGWVKGALGATVAAQGTDREVLLGLAISVSGTGIASPRLPFLFFGSNAVANTKPIDGSRLNLSYYISNAVTTWPSTYDMTASVQDNGMPLIVVY